LRALQVGARCARPFLGVRQAAPAIETIVLPTYYEIVKFDLFCDFIKYQMVRKN
jgi:hypothetical protein